MNLPLPFFGPNPYVRTLTERMLDGTLPIGYSAGQHRDEAALTALHHRMESAPRRYIELGCGSGRHLIAQGAADPKALFLGIDLRFKRVVRAAQKSKEQGVQNTLFLRMNASLLPDLCTNEAGEPIYVDGIFMHFPDPWDRARWLKNRMFSQQFLDTAAIILQPTVGWIHFRTDHEEYFQFSRALTEADPRFQIDHSRLQMGVQMEQNDKMLSEFGQLFRSKGLPMWEFFAFRKNF